MKDKIDRLEAEKSSVEQMNKEVIKSVVEQEDEYISIVDRLFDRFFLILLRRFS